MWGQDGGNRREREGAEKEQKNAANLQIGKIVCDA
jgi:hypothetical protein